jgi:two-component system cell cycle response regulator
MANEVILVVEDNPINLKLVKVLLTVEGYNVYTASQAEEALHLLNTITPHLILMDIQLPGMDGLTLTRQLKADPKYQNIYIVAVTAYAMKTDEEKAFAAGCDGYISKPINVATFSEAITKYINQPTMESEKISDKSE